MNMLANLKTDSTIEEEKDVIGGGYKPLESGLYTFTINTAYLGESKNGAMSLSIEASAENGQSLRQTIYITNRNKENFYKNKEGKKSYLPGFNIANSICLLSVGKEISELEPEEKVIKLYDYTAKSEVPTKVPMLVELVGQEIKLGILKQIVDKNVQDGNGNYVPSGETREENDIDKVFRASDNMTVAEIKAQASEAVFFSTWETKNTGVTRNKAKGVAAGSVAGAPKPASAPAPAKSLFA